MSMFDKPASQHILFVHSSDEMYGSDKVLLQIVSGLDLTQFIPIVVLPSDITYKGELSTALKELGIATHSIKMGVLRRRYFRPLGFLQYLFYTVIGVYQLRKLVKQYRAVLIHSNTSAVFGGALVARICRLPHVWHVHEILEKPRWLGSLIYRFILNASDAVVVISQAVANHMIQNTPTTINKQHLQVIWNGVDCETFRPKINGQLVRNMLGIHEDDVLSGVVGRISHWKGQELFIEATARVAKLCPQLRIVIVGSPVPGDEARLTHLQEQAKSLDIADKVQFLAFSNDIPQVMRALDFLVLPSILPEPMGLVILEAMASGRPVVAAAHGGPLETVVDGVTGLWFEPSNVVALANAMIKLTQDAQLRRTLGDRARVRAIEHFSLANFQHRFAHLYTDLLDRQNYHSESKPLSGEKLH